MKDVLIGTWAWGPGMNGTKMVFGNKQDPQALKESFDEAVKLGFLNWDTAAVYGMGSCEKFLGGLIAGHPEVFISTKFMPSKKYKKGALVKSFDESMSRLGRNCADLFWIHVPNNLEKNIAEAVPLIKDGRIKSLGVSNVSLAHIKLAQELLAKEGLMLGAVQNHFSIIRNDQQPIIDYCNANGIKYYAYMVLEQGALAGHYSYDNPFPALSFRSFLFPRKNFKKIEGLLASMRDVASKYNIDSSQVPILWVMAKGANPIVGVTKPSHVKKLAAAIDVTIDSKDVDILTEQAANSGLRQQGSWEPQ
ncbi:MAG: aldo/keto reductase [Clostridiales bacterium]|nr:aldo/keto reductase [Clostridiales bacterium]